MDTSETKSKSTTKVRQSRSTQTLLQSMYDSHYQLLEIIDRKANIVITVNSIILSLLMGGILIGVQRMDHVPSLTPIWPLIATTVGSLFFSILAIYPHKNQGNGETKNYLFYENHLGLDRIEFRKEINRIIINQLVPESLTDDIYYLGKVLAHKNRFLRISLIIFLSGMIISVALLFFLDSQ